jgi:hypothetical protein
VLSRRWKDELKMALTRTNTSCYCARKRASYFPDPMAASRCAATISSSAASARPTSIVTLTISISIASSFSRSSTPVRCDRNADATLDSEEIRALVNASASDRVSVTFRAQPSEGLTGVVKDLKLPPKKHELALAIVSRHTLPRNVNEATSSPLFGEMRAVLDDQAYEDFVAATARLSRGPITFTR